MISRNFSMAISRYTFDILFYYRYHDGGRLSDQQMALLQYQRENLHFLSEEVSCIKKHVMNSAHTFHISGVEYIMNLIESLAVPVDFYEI